MAHQTSPVLWVLALFLTIVFVVLKAGEKIDWSWWTVASPLWGLAAVVLVAIAIWGRPD